jgi:hypothetical protein
MLSCIGIKLNFVLVTMKVLTIDVEFLSTVFGFMFCVFRGFFLLADSDVVGWFYFSGVLF